MSVDSSHRSPNGVLADTVLQRAEDTGRPGDWRDSEYRIRADGTSVVMRMLYMAGVPGLGIALRFTIGSIESAAG